MFRLKYDLSSIGKIFYPDICWTSSTNKVLLTIDDSPNSQITERILTTLDENKITALFFCIGRNIEQTGSLVSEISSAGHEIGNHGYNHVNLCSCSPEQVKVELEKTSGIIAEKTNCLPRFFRPPFGRFNRKITGAASEIGLQTILWSLITYDYKNDINLVKLTFRFLRGNAIVVLHDNTKNAGIICESISLLNEYLQEHNLQFGTPLECLK